jgi:glycine/D-amino acid oxidase-like deaminating enzyme
VVHAVGWCGHGVALSLASGAWVARLVCDGEAGELPWFRADPPLVPLEPVRWVGFRAAVAAMELLDRWT